MMKKFVMLPLMLCLSMQGNGAGHTEQMLIEQDQFLFWYNLMAQQTTPKLPKISLNNTKKTETKQIAKGVTMKITKGSLDGWLGKIDIKCTNVSTESTLNKCLTAMMTAAYATDTEIDSEMMQETLEMVLENGNAQYLDKGTEIEYNILFSKAKKQFDFNIQAEGGHIIPLE